MALLFSNNAVGTLAAPITSVAVLITLNAGQAGAFPSPIAPDVFYATLTDAATESIIEIVKVTAVSGNIFSVVRAQDSTTAKSWLANDFISQRAIAIEMRLWNAIVPSGGIILWSGSVASIPQGWVLCDGTLSTPDLRDRFVVGSGGAFAVGQTGGSADASLPSHTHTAASTSVSTVTDPGHAHVNASGFVVFTGGGPIFTQSSGDLAVQNMNSAVTHITVATATTTVNTATGVSPTGLNLPPYYSLAYIMKT